jgi:RHS repeat-associated protein
LVTVPNLPPQRYFGGKRLGAATDRLGSVRGRYDTINGASNTTYYPYGEDKDNPQPDGAFAFATYTKDVQGLDYAMNRYYSNVAGRFYSPDPGGIRTADPKEPRSWNRYAYVQSDPVNFNDRRGLFLCGICVSSGEPELDPGPDPSAGSLFPDNANSEMVPETNDGEAASPGRSGPPAPL